LETARAIADATFYCRPRRGLIIAQVELIIVAYFAIALLNVAIFARNYRGPARSVFRIFFFLLLFAQSACVALATSRLSRNKVAQMARMKKLKPAL